MRKAKSDMRPEYKRSDFGRLERGKFHIDVASGGVVVTLDPAIAKAFPTSKAVNEALHALLEFTERTSKIKRGAGRGPRKQSSG